MEADVLIIGAGVVGLACAAELARSGQTVLVVERHASAGREASSMSRPAGGLLETTGSSITSASAP